MNEDWRQEAACRGMDTNCFFPGLGEPLTEALAACGRCEVRQNCLEAGMSEPFGVFGGLSDRQRRKLRARTGRYVNTCEECGDRFAALVPQRVHYCSEVCRRASKAKRQRRYLDKTKGAA